MVGAREGSTGAALARFEQIAPVTTDVDEGPHRIRMVADEQGLVVGEVQSNEVAWLRQLGAVGDDERNLAEELLAFSLGHDGVGEHRRIDSENLISQITRSVPNVAEQPFECLRRGQACRACVFDHRFSSGSEA